MKFAKHTALIIILASLMVGGGAGMVTSILTNDALDDYANALLGDRGFTALEPRKPSGNPLDYAEAVNRVRDTQARTVAVIAPKTENSASSSAWLGGTDGAGLGVVVSANGWVLTTTNELTSFRDPSLSAEVWIRGTRYAIGEVVEDNLTNYVLLRLENANGLSAIGFGASADARSGDMVFVISDASGLVTTTLQNSEWPRLNGPQPAESFVTAWQLADSQLVAGPVLSTSGDLLGFVGSDGLATPLHYASAFVQEVLRNGEMMHAAVGAYVTDVSHVYNLEADLSQGFSTGILVFAGSGKNAVPAGTPAAEGGLLTRDLITAVDNEAITQYVSLAELLTAYDPGQTARLSIVRDGSPLEIDIVLGDAGLLIY